MVDGYARTFDEANLYMELRPCACGEADPGARGTSRVDGGARFQEYSGRCAGCDRPRRFTFEMPVELPPVGDDVRYGWGDEPSRLLDAAEWLTVADAFADGARLMRDGLEATDPDEEALNVVFQLISSASAALDEVLKFVPPGAAGVPRAALWTEPGQQLFDDVPERFRASRLAAELADRRRELDELAAAYGGAVR
jgi:hypothetical protein